MEESHPASPRLSNNSGNNSINNDEYANTSSDHENERPPTRRTKKITTKTRTTTTPPNWKHSAAKAEENLSRILRDIDLDGIIVKSSSTLLDEDDYESVYSGALTSMAGGDSCSITTASSFSSRASGSTRLSKRQQLQQPKQLEQRQSPQLPLGPISIPSRNRTRNSLTSQPPPRQQKGGISTSNSAATASAQKVAGPLAPSSTTRGHGKKTVIRDGSSARKSTLPSTKPPPRKETSYGRGYMKAKLILQQSKERRMGLPPRQEKDTRQQKQGQHQQQEVQSQPNVVCVPQEKEVQEALKPDDNIPETPLPEMKDEQKKAAKDEQQPESTTSPSSSNNKHAKLDESSNEPGVEVQENQVEEEQSKQQENKQPQNEEKSINHDVTIDGSAARLDKQHDGNQANEQRKTKTSNTKGDSSKKKKKSKKSQTKKKQDQGGETAQMMAAMEKILLVQEKRQKQQQSSCASEKDTEEKSVDDKMRQRMMAMDADTQELFEQFLEKQKSSEEEVTIGEAASRESSAISSLSGSSSMQEIQAAEDKPKEKLTEKKIKGKAEKKKKAKKKKCAKKQAKNADVVAEVKPKEEKHQKKVHKEETNAIAAEQKQRAEQEAKEAEEERRRIIAAKEEEAAAAAAAAEAERKRQEEEEDQQRRKDLVDLVESILQHAKLEDGMMAKDAHYKVLGLPSNASEANIKKAYRKLALKLHPDKERYNTPHAREAFDAILAAYEVLKDPATRHAYDQEGTMQSNGGSSAVVPTEASMAFPAGTRVTIQGHEHDVRYAPFNGMHGCILSLDPRSGWYTVKLDNGTSILADAISLFQNAVVCLRAGVAKELGTFLATLESSQWRQENNPQGPAAYYCYFQARYNAGAQEMSTYLRPEQFIIPTGTLVRLTGLQDERVNRKYGTIVDWKESFDAKCDVSYYEVRLSDGKVIRVQMANVTL